MTTRVLGVPSIGDRNVLSGFDAGQIEFIDLYRHFETGIAIDLAEMLAAGFFFADMGIKRSQHAVRRRAHGQRIELGFGGRKIGVETRSPSSRSDHCFA